jgi:hypothetical protein
MSARATVAWLREPVGPIYLAAAVLSLGRGAWLTCWVIFFTHSIGLSTAEFGIGITAAGLVGLIVGSPLGYLADRVGARETLIGIGVVQGLTVLCYSFAQGFWAVCLIACVAVSAERAAPGVRIAVIAGLTTAKERLRAISTMRVVTQSGVVLGTLVGSLILYLDTRAAYLGLVLCYGLLNIVFAFLLVRVPRVESLADRKANRKVLVLRDRPFLLVTLLNGLLMLNWGMLGSGVPLWIMAHTGAPIWIAGMLMGFNSLVTVLFQRRASRQADTVTGAARLGVRAGITLACSCPIFASTYHASGVVVVVVFLIAAAVHVVGELWGVASGWGLSVGLTRHQAHGEYQGMFAAGTAGAQMLAPGVMTLLLVDWGVAGWFALAAVFLIGGVPMTAVSRWATRADQARERDTVTL